MADAAAAPPPVLVVVSEIETGDPAAAVAGGASAAIVRSGPTRTITARVLLRFVAFGNHAAGIGPGHDVVGPARGTGRDRDGGRPR